jgi:photosynthetic reaction center H subunit
METGALTGYLDVAQVVLYVFWIFFAGLVFYLLRENKREGYPLESDRSPHITVVGWPRPPAPKTYRLAHGGSVTVPSTPSHVGELAAAPAAPFPGAPLQPTGDPMQDGVGPAAYPARADETDKTFDGRDKIVPLRAAPEMSLVSRDPDPRGMPVIGCDGIQGGTISDVWVDRSDPLVRYFEVTSGTDEAPHVTLVPYNFAHIERRRSRVKVNAVRGDQFATAPGLANPDRVTLLEEDRISAYYAGGLLYATPQRSEPLL